MIICIYIRKSDKNPFRLIKTFCLATIKIVSNRKRYYILYEYDFISQSMLVKCDWNKWHIGPMRYFISCVCCWAERSYLPNWFQVIERKTCLPTKKNHIIGDVNDHLRDRDVKMGLPYDFTRVRTYIYVDCCWWMMIMCDRIADNGWNWIVNRAIRCPA